MQFLDISQIEQVSVFGRNSYFLYLTSFKSTKLINNRSLRIMTYLLYENCRCMR